MCRGADGAAAKVEDMPALPPGFPVPTQPPRFGERPTPNVIWNADFIIHTSVISRAAESRQFYNRLAVQLAKMTARRDFGRAHIPWLALQEMAAAAPPRRQALFTVVLNLYRELHEERISVTGDLGAIISREWTEPGGSASYPWEELEPQLIACIRGDGQGTKLLAQGQVFQVWREDHWKRF